MPTQANQAQTVAPMMYRAAATLPSSYDEADNSIEICWTMRNNTASTSSVTSSNSASRTVDTLLNRIDANNVEAIFEGVTRQTVAQAAAAVPTALIQIGRDGSKFSKFSFGAVTAGAKLSTAQKAARLRVIQNMRKKFGGG